MKVTQALVFAAYYMAIDADDAWHDNLVRARVNRYAAGAQEVAGYQDKLRADATWHDALGIMRHGLKHLDVLFA